MAEATKHLVESRGLFRGLPTFPEDLKGLTAVVTGANGISGSFLVKALAESPERWTKIYALSRRAPTEPLPDQVEHIAIDFLMSDSEEIARTLRERGVKPDHVFFCSYLQPPADEGKTLWENADLLTSVNTRMLSNFLEALPLADALPKRILIQFGMKYYGVHLGPAAYPQEETDPRVGEHLEPNFYYAQHDELTAFCERHDIGWNDTRPGWVLGAVRDAAMNITLPIGIYASVQRHLKQPLIFPGDLAAWLCPHTNSTAMLIGYLSEWAVLTEGVRNESLNATDDSAFTFGKFWPKLAGWYGLDHRPPSERDDDYREIPFKHDVPPRGFGPKGRLRFAFTFVEWSGRPEVQAAWAELAAEHGLSPARLTDVERIFGFLDYILSSVPQLLNADKLKRLGFFGSVDSTASYRAVLDDFARMKMLPPVQHVV